MLFSISNYDSYAFLMETLTKQMKLRLKFVVSRIVLNIYIYSLELCLFAINTGSFVIVNYL